MQIEEHVVGSRSGNMLRPRVRPRPWGAPSAILRLPASRPGLGSHGHDHGRSHALRHLATAAAAPEQLKANVRERAEDAARTRRQARGFVPGTVELPPAPPLYQMTTRLATILTELGWMRLRLARGVAVDIRATKMRETFIRLGPAFVKAGQALATRPDVFPPEVCVELAKLQHQMPPFDSTAARAMIEAELGAPVDELFSEFSSDPIAAASLGQVYRARVAATGQEVAVKVQRPGLEPRIILDAHVLVSVPLPYLCSPYGTHLISCEPNPPPYPKPKT